DKTLTEKLGLKTKEQIKLFLTFCQLAGHPTMYDVLPQTGRYSRTVLSKPFIARWFDIKELNRKLKIDLDDISQSLETFENAELVKQIKHIISDSLDGDSENIPQEGSDIEEKMEQMLDLYRKKYSEEMTSKLYQQELVNKVKKIITDELELPENTTLKEEDFDHKHDKVIGTLINKGLWPSPGGAWCSSGIPVYKRMVSGGGFPLFDHFDVDGNDVTHMANLDCQTPFFFVHLESGEYNQTVIDFWCDFLVELQKEYNFDGFRIDHIDHIVDRVSQSHDGRPLSYRAPSKVLGTVSRILRQNNKHFGLLAEYMLWDRFYKEYHQDMGFDLLWGSDIVNQHMKNVKTILHENEELKQYNSIFGANQSFLSILKAYNNQDGEFREIDQYPGQMEEEGALFKWFKLKFTPSGPLSERPIMFIDGDESFTRTGIERVIGTEGSLHRDNNIDFFRKFTAINNFALNNILCRYGISEIFHGNELESGLIAWYVKKLPEFGDDERLFIIANENPPKEVIRLLNDSNELISVWKDYESVKNAQIWVPEGFVVVSEYILPENNFIYIESLEIKNLEDCVFKFNELKPSEFHFYKIKRI
ncbi:MAG: hypothetical protein AB1782_11510, partial [Cyanobacteriota bacterium]